MTDLTFEQQLWLAVIDKAVLASVLVGVGYVANRTLESYKARETLRAKLTEARMPKIAAHIAGLSALEARLEDINIRALMNAKQLVRGDAAEPAPEDPLRVRDTFITDFIKNNGPRDDVSADIDSALRMLENDRFWLGNSFFEEMKNQFIDLKLLCMQPQMAFMRTASTVDAMYRFGRADTIMTFLRMWIPLFNVAFPRNQVLRARSDIAKRDVTQVLSKDWRELR